MSVDVSMIRGLTSQVAFGKIEETELRRRIALLRLFCKIVISVVTVCWVLQIVSAFLVGRLSPVASIVIGSIVSITFIAWRLVERDQKHYRAASWLMISGVLVTTLFTYAFFGGNSPLILIFLVPLGLAAALLSFGETVGVCLFIMAYSAALYVGQHALKIYEPPLQVQGIGAMIMGLIMCGIILPLVSALITFPALSKARLLQNQNRELQAALANLENRQQLSENASRQVLELAGELKNQANRQENGTSQQSESLWLIGLSGENLTHINQNIAASAANIRQRAADVQKSTQAVSQTAQLVVQSGETGLASVQQTITSNLRVNEQYEHLLKSLSGLGKTSETIKSVIGLLQNIASETHLLALNAAIEAAGAGDAGSRFGVIAQEVRELAERSQNAAKEVNATLANVDREILTAVETARQGQTASQEAVAVARQSGIIITQLAHALTETAAEVHRIDASLEEVNAQLEQIGDATRRQNTASEQVLSALHSIETISSQTTAGSVRLSLTAGSLEEVSRRLQLSLSVT
jgi:methyl-accepting chemotaxis protein